MTFTRDFQDDLSDVLSKVLDNIEAAYQLREDDVFTWSAIARHTIGVNIYGGLVEACVVAEKYIGS